MGVKSSWGLYHTPLQQSCATATLVTSQFYSLSSLSYVQNIIKQMVFWKKNSNSTAVLFMACEWRNTSLGFYPYEAKKIKKDRQILTDSLKDIKDSI